MLQLFYPAVYESIRENSVCLESGKYGNLKPEKHQENLPLWRRRSQKEEEGEQEQGRRPRLSLKKLIKEKNIKPIKRISLID